LVAEKSGLWDAATSRAEAQVLRLSMVYALLDGTGTIDVPHLRAALAAWNYCDESARLIFNRSEETSTLEGKIRRVVKERPGIGRTELRDSISHKLKSCELEKALAWLANRKEIERRSERHGERLYPVVDDAGSTPLACPTLPAPVDSPVAPTPLAPVSVDVELQAADDDTKEIDGEEYIRLLSEGLDAIDAQYEQPEVAPAPLSELLDWRNAKGAVFFRQADGTIWVSHEDGNLTPALRSTIRANQETLAAFLPAYSTAV
jgi:hypothetical protein